MAYRETANMADDPRFQKILDAKTVELRRRAWFFQVAAATITALLVLGWARYSDLRRQDGEQIYHLSTQLAEADAVAHTWSERAGRAAENRQLHACERELENTRLDKAALAERLMTVLRERYPERTLNPTMDEFGEVIRIQYYWLNDGESLPSYASHRFPSQRTPIVNAARELNDRGCPTRASIEFNRLLGLGTQGWTSRGLCPNSVPRPRVATPIAVSRTCSVGMQETRAGAELSALAARVRTIACDLRRNNAAVNDLSTSRPR